MSCIKFIIVFALFAACLASADPGSASATETLSAMDVWLIAPPKFVEPLPDVSFRLETSAGIAASGDRIRDLATLAAERVARASGVRLPVMDACEGNIVALVLAESMQDVPSVANVDESTFEMLGDQGYVLAVTADGVTLASRTPEGLLNGIVTLSQVATDRAVLPGMVIRDWPSLTYRGAQQDVSRGQVPTPETLMRLADVLAEGKMNVIQLYIEHVYKYRAFPDISPPEGYTPEEAKALSIHAARAGIEVHPLLQGLGHAYHILSKPQYEHLRISASEKSPWTMTFDIRKPEAVQMVTTMLEELCQTFAGKLFAVDITEIDVEGLQADGMTLEQVTTLVYSYVLQLHDVAARHGRRLMIAQGPLDSQGHLSGMGPKLDRMPKDVIIGSYYCAGGPYQPAWEKDFPRLRDLGVDFFSQAWIYSHVWLTPWVTKSAEFSDLEVARGLAHGALGSITTDWGDAGHFHFVGEEWLPFLYHGACAWSGAQVDREYFRKSFARILYRLDSDAAVRATEAASDINGIPLRVRDKNGVEAEVATTYIWEFFHDPFTHPDITRIVDPAAAGQAILAIAEPAVRILNEETTRATRNRDALEQQVFGARCYSALGHKLVALGHYNDSGTAREQVAAELESVAREYETLQLDFQRLWLAENRENAGFHELVKRFVSTIVPLREKSKALLAQ